MECDAPRVVPPEVFPYGTLAQGHVLNAGSENHQATEGLQPKPHRAEMILFSNSGELVLDI